MLARCKPIGAYSQDGFNRATVTTRGQLVLAFGGKELLDPYRASRSSQKDRSPEDFFQKAPPTPTQVAAYGSRSRHGHRADSGNRRATPRAEGTADVFTDERALPGHTQDTAEGRGVLNSGRRRRKATAWPGVPKRSFFDTARGVDLGSARRGSHKGALATQASWHAWLAVTPAKQNRNER